MTRLLVDRMLGRLATWLRLLGFDAPLIQQPPAHLGPQEVLLSRRRALRGQAGVVFVAHDRLEDQLRQVLAELKLRPDPGALFSRCLRCNRVVEPVERAQVEGLVPEYTLHTAQGFTRCPGCGRVYWSGSHGQRALAMLRRIDPHLAPD